MDPNTITYGTVIFVLTQFKPKFNLYRIESNGNSVMTLAEMKFQAYIYSILMNSYIYVRIL